MANVSGQFRRAVALLLALAFMVAPLAPSAAGHSHSTSDTGLAVIDGPHAPSHQENHGHDPLDLRHCGFLACNVFLPLAGATVGVPPTSRATMIAWNDLAPERRWVGIDPPVPR